MPLTFQLQGACFIEKKYRTVDLSQKGFPDAGEPVGVPPEPSRSREPVFTFGIFRHQRPESRPLDLTDGKSGFSPLPHHRLGEKTADPHGRRRKKSPGKAGNLRALPGQITGKRFHHRCLTGVHGPGYQNKGKHGPF